MHIIHQAKQGLGTGIRSKETEMQSRGAREVRSVTKNGREENAHVLCCDAKTGL